MTTQLIDHATLNELREALGDELDGIVKLYVDGLPTQSAELVALLAAHDLPTLRRSAHSLKGSSVSMGAVLLGARAGEGEGPPLLLGLFPALLCPMFLAYCLVRVRAIRALRDGRTAIARWVVPAQDFRAFCAREEAVPAGSIAVNYYRPPRRLPAGEVMTRQPKTIERDALASEALEQLNALKITSLFLDRVPKTGRCVVASHCVGIGSYTGEIASRVMAEAFDSLDAPVLRVGASDGTSTEVSGPVKEGDVVVVGERAKE